MRTTRQLLEDGFGPKWADWVDGLKTYSNGERQMVMLTEAIAVSDEVRDDPRIGIANYGYLKQRWAAEPGLAVRQTTSGMRAIALDLDKKAPMDLVMILDQLDEDPVLDVDSLEIVEAKNIRRAWDRYGRDELKEMLSSKWSEYLDDNETIDAVVESARQRSGVAPEATDPHDIKFYNQQVAATLG